MKTKFNLSEIMTRAHKIARCIKTYQNPYAKYAALLSEAIRQAWGEARTAIQKAAEQTERLAERARLAAYRTSLTPADIERMRDEREKGWNAAIIADYQRGMGGRVYYGD